LVGAEVGKGFPQTRGQIVEQCGDIRRRISASMSFSDRNAVPLAMLPDKSIFFSVKSGCSAR
jgi:hypothetical protein